jgi:hypothetical protein
MLDEIRSDNSYNASLQNELSVNQHTLEHKDLLDSLWFGLTLFSTSSHGFNPPLPKRRTPTTTLHVKQESRPSLAPLNV